MINFKTVVNIKPLKLPMRNYRSEIVSTSAVNLTHLLGVNNASFTHYHH